MTRAEGEVTALLRAWNKGDSLALDELMPRVYAELHRIARRYMAGERLGHSLQASALINEAYIRLVDWKNVEWKNRCHFFAVGAQMMRRVLVDHARLRQSRKRGGSANRVTLDTAVMGVPERSLDLIVLDTALARLEHVDPRKSKVVELRVFGGLTVDEVAEVMDTSEVTIRRDWKLALAWIRRELKRPTPR